MDALREHLNAMRSRYLDSYRKAIHSKRAEGHTCATEVWIAPNVPQGQRRPPHPLCADILIQAADRPEVHLVTAEELTEGPRRGTVRIGDMEADFYPAFWESFPVWVLIADPDWSALDSWRERWMDPDKPSDGDEDGLHGVVHYIGAPIREGGGFVYHMDFGSAPVQAVLELLEAFAAMGVKRVELGLSDGSDLPAEVQKTLRDPDLSIEELTRVVAGLVAALPGVTGVEIVAPNTVEVRVGEEQQGPRIFIDNLYRLLLRTGVEARAKEVYRFVRGQHEALGPDEAPDLSQLQLSIKDDRYFENIREMAAEMKPIVRASLAADLWVTCVWDMPNGMRFVSTDEPQQYGLSPEQFLSRARENYVNGRPEPEISEHASLLVAQTGDCYDASLLLDDAWLDEMAGKVQGEMLACVPARHVVLLGGMGNPGTLRDMREVASRVEEAGDHLISRTILVRRDGKWHEFERDKGDSPHGERSAAPVPAKKPWWKFW